MTNEADLVLVVLSYGDGPAAGLVDHLIATGAHPGQIVVVHNPSPSTPAPQAMREEVRVICCPENLGYGAGMNVGRAAALAEAPRALVALITHDVMLDFADLAALAVELGADTGIGIVAPRLVAPDGGTLTTGGVLDRWGNVRHLVDATGARSESRDWVDGAVLVVSPDAPPLPERYFLYMDDVAYCVVTRKAGLDVRIVPSVIAVTDPKAAYRKELFRYLHWRNRLALSRSELTRAATVAGAGKLVVAAVGRCSQTALRERRLGPPARLMRTYWLALWHGLRLRLGAPTRSFD